MGWYSVRTPAAPRRAPRQARRPSRRARRAGPISRRPASSDGSRRQRRCVQGVARDGFHSLQARAAASSALKRVQRARVGACRACVRAGREREGRSGRTARLAPPGAPHRPYAPPVFPCAQRRSECARGARRALPARPGLRLPARTAVARRRTSVPARRVPRRPPHGRCTVARADRWSRCHRDSPYPVPTVAWYKCTPAHKCRSVPWYKWNAGTGKVRVFLPEPHGALR